MNPRDAIVLALTPGSPFNANGLVFRSVQSLRAFTQLEVPEIMEILAGDLAAQVTCRPSKKPEKGLMVALKAYIPAPGVQQVQIAGGPAFHAPLAEAVVKAAALNAPIHVGMPSVEPKLSEAFVDADDEFDDGDDGEA